MVISKNKSYKANGSITFENMLDHAKKVLQSMGSKEIVTQNLDKTFIRLLAKMPPDSQYGPQITIAVYQEGDKFFIQSKAEVFEAEQFWTKFETYILGNSDSAIEVPNPNSEKSNPLIDQGFQSVNELCRYIREQGGIIDEEHAWNFVMNYHAVMNQLPSSTDIPEIAQEYLENFQTLVIPSIAESEPNNDINLAPKIVQVGVNAPKIQITAQDALHQMLRDISTLEPDTLENYFSIMNKMELEDQPKFINKIRQVETDMNKVPYLLIDERKSLRDEILELPTEKRRAKLLKIIKERQKNESYFSVRYSEQIIKQQLNELAFLQPGDVDDIMNVILTLSLNEKQKIIDVVKEIENTFNQMASQDVKIAPITRKSLRLDLIRLNSKERSAEYEKIVEEYRSERVKKVLFEAIPSFRYEKNDSIIKELLWLNDDDLQRRINLIKANMEKEKEEKTKEFEKSSSTSACKKCGWPLSTFSKKCPRCGYQTDDWFKL